jgi:hypothetical protein
VPIAIPVSVVISLATLIAMRLQKVFTQPNSPSIKLTKSVRELVVLEDGISRPRLRFSGLSLQVDGVTLVNPIPEEGFGSGGEVFHDFVSTRQCGQASFSAIGVSCFLQRTEMIA